MMRTNTHTHKHKLRCRVITIITVFPVVFQSFSVFRFRNRPRRRAGARLEPVQKKIGLASGGVSGPSRESRVGVIIKPARAAVAVAVACV